MAHLNFFLRLAAPLFPSLLTRWNRNIRIWFIEEILNTVAELNVLFLLFLVCINLKLGVAKVAPYIQHIGKILIQEVLAHIQQVIYSLIMEIFYILLLVNQVKQIANHTHIMVVAMVKFGPRAIHKLHREVDARILHIKKANLNR